MYIQSVQTLETKFSSERNGSPKSTKNVLMYLGLNQIFFYRAN